MDPLARIEEIEDSLPLKRQRRQEAMEEASTLFFMIAREERELEGLKAAREGLPMKFFEYHGAAPSMPGYTRFVLTLRVSHTALYNHWAGHVEEDDERRLERGYRDIVITQAKVVHSYRSTGRPGPRVKVDASLIEMMEVEARRYFAQGAPLERLMDMTRREEDDTPPGVRQTMNDVTCCYVMVRDDLQAACIQDV